MSVDEEDLNFCFEHRNKSDFEYFSNRAKTFILHDDKFISQRLNVFNFLKNVSDDELVNNRRSNYRRINLSNFCENCVSSRN
jgi:hypothetical protein